MKDFDLEKAKAGHPVCTRDGRDARILAFDIKDDDYPICAAITGDIDSEYTCSFTKDGKFLSSIARHHSDLMMKSIKHEGWVNIYGISQSCIGYKTSRDIYPSESHARKNRSNENYITTIKIEWEE